MILHSQASLAGLSDSMVAAVAKVSAELEKVGVKPKIVPSMYRDTVAFSLRSVPADKREKVANLAWGSLGVEFLVHLFKDRFVVQHRKPS